MNAGKIGSEQNYIPKKGKISAALILAGSVALGCGLGYTGYSKQQERNNLIAKNTHDWTLARIERILRYIPGTSNSEVIAASIKVIGNGDKLDFTVRNRANGEEYIIHCNIDDNSCSDPRPVRHHEFSNIIPSEK